MNSRPLVRSLIVCVFSLPVHQWAAASETKLPDDTEFEFWEEPLQFAKTYYVNCNAPNCDDDGPGTIDRPFRTIGKAAEVLQPGQRVVIASGIYRECIRPARGGTGPTQMISYEAALGAKVFVRGSEALDNNDLERSTMPSRGRGGGDAFGGGQVTIWKYQLTGDLFPDAYNPFALASVAGDWSWLDTKTVDMGPYFRRRGLVFVNGMPLEPMEQSRELGNTPLRPWIPTPPPETPPASRGGLPSRTPGGAIMQEVGGSSDARFAVESSGNIIYMRMPGDTPENPLVEITTRERVFFPMQSGLGYIRIKGITFQHAGNGYPPPQNGLVSTYGGHHWIIEDNTIEWANGVSLDIGGGWSGGTVQQAGLAHVIRGNTIRHCGVCGICGQRTRNVLIEDNTLEWIGWADAERGWEAGAVKFHNATNMLLRRNVIRHIRHANAVWYDVGNSNCRVTRNVLADVLTVSAAVHMEMTRNYNLIDNNIIWNVRNSEPGTPGQRGAAGSGVFIHATDRVGIVQNIIGHCDNDGVYPVLRPDRRGSGTGSENNVYNNIFVHCGKAAIVFLNESNEADGNVYVSMPDKFLGFAEGETTKWTDLTEWQESCGWDINSVTSDMNIEFDPDTLELTMDARELPTVAVFAEVDTDMFGKSTGDKRVPGPLADPGIGPTRRVDPRETVD